MADKIFGLDFTNESNPLATYTLSVNNGSALVDIQLQDIIDLFTATANPPLRNVIINGDMQVSQRGTSFSGMAGATTYALDRWLPIFGSLGTWTVSQDTDVPTGYPFRKSLKLLVTTADAAPAAGDVAFLRTRLEGQNVQAFLKGSASAKAFALSFHVKSSNTGTYVAELQDVDNTRHVNANFTINAANTWERKTITFPADTSGVFDNDSSASLNLNIWFASGTNFTSGTLASTWAAEVAANRAVGLNVNLGGTINNYMNITGVQLEPVTQTEFELVPFDIQLHRCQRYFWKTFPYGTTPAQNVGIVGCMRFIAGKAGALINVGSCSMLNRMRATPTLVFYNPSAANAQVRDTTAGADCSGTGTGGNASDQMFSVFCTGNASTAVGNILEVHGTAEAEL